MPASKRFLNWSGVTFTPAGGTAIVINEVQSMNINDRVTLTGESGDADAMPSAKTLTYLDPQVTIRAQDIGALESLIPGVRGTLTGILNDFYNGEGTGARTYTISNCVVGSNTTDDTHRQAAVGTKVLETYSPDGRTSPIAVAVAA